MILPKEISKYEDMSPTPVIYWTKVRLWAHATELFSMRMVNFTSYDSLIKMIYSDDEGDLVMAEALIEGILSKYEL